MILTDQSTHSEVQSGRATIENNDFGIDEIRFDINKLIVVIISNEDFQTWWPMQKCMWLWRVQNTRCRPCMRRRKLALRKAMQLFRCFQRAPSAKFERKFSQQNKIQLCESQTVKTNQQHIDSFIALASVLFYSCHVATTRALNIWLDCENTYQTSSCHPSSRLAIGIDLYSSKLIPPSSTTYTSPECILVRQPEGARK